jgi:hypothetical protein
MRKLVVVAVLALSVPVFAASAHWITGPDASISGNTLTVTGKAAGLGKTVASVDFYLTGQIEVDSRCYTKSGNKPQAANKQEFLQAGATGDFPVRNGAVNVSISQTPVSSLTCTPGQRVVIESVSCLSLAINSGQFPELNSPVTCP